MHGLQEHTYMRTCTRTRTRTCVFTVVRAYQEVMQTSLTSLRCLILCAGLRCSWGMRRTEKGIITFLPKHRNSMNYLRYTRRGPRQLRDWTTQDSVKEPGGQRPAEEPGGISGDPKVTSKGKLNDKKQKGGVGSGEWSAHSYTDFSNVCMFTQRRLSCTDELAKEYTFTRPSPLIHARFP